MNEFSFTLHFLVMVMFQRQMKMPQKSERCQEQNESNLKQPLLKFHIGSHQTVSSWPRAGFFNDLIQSLTFHVKSNPFIS